MNNNVYFASPAPLIESGEGWGDFIDPREFMYDDPSFGYGGSGSLCAMPSRPDDRDDGKFLPYYQHEMDLAMIRGISRSVVAISPNGKGMIDTLANYVIGKGFTFTVVPEEDQEPPDAILKDVQAVLKETLEKNKFTNNLDREIFLRGIEDGESINPIEQGKDGLAEILQIEPDDLSEPRNAGSMSDYAWETMGIHPAGVPSWSFGVFTDRRRPDMPLAYHVCFGCGGMDYEIYPANRLEHYRRNVSRRAKRGVGDFYQVWRNLLKSLNLTDATVSGETVREKIAYIQQLPKGTTGQQAAGLVTDQANGLRRIPAKGGGFQQVRTRRIQNGSIETIPNGMEMKDGPGTNRTDFPINLGSFVLRNAGVRWSMPEYMANGDASNANLASSMTAESPFVKACEAEQETCAEVFVCLLWKCIGVAIQSGALKTGGLKIEDLKKLIRIKADPPAVATRDMLKLAQTHAIQIDKGLLSKETAITEEGHDPKEELPRIEEERQEAQERQQQQMDMFAQQGLGPDGKPPQKPGDNPPDNNEPSPAMKGALQGAMESVATTAEAKAILESLTRDYP